MPPNTRPTKPLTAADAEEEEDESVHPETESTETEGEEAPTKSIYDLQPDDE